MPPAAPDTVALDRSAALAVTNACVSAVETTTAQQGARLNSVQGTVVNTRTGFGPCKDPLSITAGIWPHSMDRWRS